MQFREWLIITESKEEKALALELAGDALQELNSVIPQNQKDSDQLLLLAAYFYSKQKNLSQIKKDIQDYIALVKNNKMPLIKVNLQNKSPDKPFDDYLHWTQVIHGHQAEESYKQAKKFKPSDIDFQNEKPIETSPDGKIKVYRANSPQQCIILGKGQTFCISQPGNTMWKSYRDTKGSTFYFVYDDTREDELGIVVVDATNHGIELTDKRNTTGKTLHPFTGKITTDSNSYIKYLEKKGIDTSVFVNLPKTKEEIAEDEKLGRFNDDLNWFIALSPTEKSNYIGRGHRLTDEQFDYLWNNKFSSLLEQYVKTGLHLYDYQIDKIASNVDLRKNYIHNRMIAQNNTDFEINEKEFQYLNEKQINELSASSINHLLADRSSLNRDKIAKTIIQYKKELSEDNVYHLIRSLDIFSKDIDKIVDSLGVEYINKLSDPAVTSLVRDAEYSDEMAKFIIKHKKELTEDNVYSLLYWVDYAYAIGELLGAEKISKLSDDNIEVLLQSRNNRDIMAELIIEYKKELTDENVNKLLLYAENTDKIAKLIIKHKKELTENNVKNLISYAKNKDEIKEILKQYGRI